MELRMDIKCEWWPQVMCQGGMCSCTCVNFFLPYSGVLVAGSLSVCGTVLNILNTLWVFIFRKSRSLLSQITVKDYKNPCRQMKGIYCTAGALCLVIKLWIRNEVPYFLWPWTYVSLQTEMGLGFPDNTAPVFSTCFHLFLTSRVFRLLSTF